ncbi:MAG TPA: type IV toxin-antitoxin system AbiEi family antitoxin domain-containing protein [Myxococcota bacterium]|nr:type IV toxin-antitoxin system AbiEi family antitoxin domain-containing protein [Myxococcota bacterium]
MAKPRTAEQRALAIVRKTGILRPRDLDREGIARTYLQRLARRGLLERAGRGLYRLSSADLTEHHGLAAASKLVPNGVVCLLSALQFHDLTTQAPHEVWLAIDRLGWRPRQTTPPLRIVRFSGRALTEGVKVHTIEGVRVPIYSPAKSVADCFKYRNKLGLDVAIEALRDYRRRHPRGVDELWRYARICRVANVMRPYMEAQA